MLVMPGSIGLAPTGSFWPTTLLCATSCGAVLARLLHRLVGMWLRLDDGMASVQQVCSHFLVHRVRDFVQATLHVLKVASIVGLRLRT